MQGENLQGHLGVWEINVIVPGQNGDSMNKEMWTDSKYILKLEWLSPTDKMDIGDEAKGVIKNNS